MRKRVRRGRHRDGNEERRGLSERSVLFRFRDVHLAPLIDQAVGCIDRAVEFVRVIGTVALRKQARRDPWLVLSPPLLRGSAGRGRSPGARSGLWQRPARASVGRWLWTRTLDVCPCRGCEPDRTSRGFSWPARLASRPVERLTQARLTGTIPIKWGPAGDVTGLARSPQRSRVARR